MRKSKFGELIFSENDLCNLLMQGHELDFKVCMVDDDIKVHDLADILDNVPRFVKYNTKWDAETVEHYDENRQKNWHMPQEYKDMDIAHYVLDQCQNDAELQRAGQEILLFVEYNLLDLLKYLKYLVDTMRENNVVWGVGRGSSVASFVLFLLGVHKINSLYFDLDINEFLH